MDVTVRNLVNRGNRFYFRYRLPANYLPGKIREIKISLKTNDLKKAVFTCKLASEKTKSIIDSGAYRTMELQVMRRIIVDFIVASLEDSENHISGYGRMCPDTRAEGRASMLKFSALLEKALLDGDYDFIRAKVTAEDMLKEVPHQLEDINRMAREYLKAQLYLARNQRERIEGSRLSANFTEQDYNEILSGNYRTAEQIMEDEKTYPLGEMVKNYLEAPHPTWGPSMRSATENSLKLLVEYFSPGTDIRAIKLDDMEFFRDKIVMKLPANRTTNPKYHKMSLEEAVKANTGKTLALKTVNTFMSNINTFFLWNYKRRRIDRNPAEDLVIKNKPDKDDSRTSFNDEELKKIFELLREDKLNAWMPYKLLIPLISLYNGCRQNEICQLQITDIVNVGGIACFNITTAGNDKKRLKNDSSRRMIPIHRTLLELNILDHVLKMKNSRMKNPDKLLWIQMTYNVAHGYGDRFQKFFGRFLRKSVTDNRRLVFHSFRYCFCDKLKQTGISLEMAKALAGHKDNSMTFEHYANPFAPDKMVEPLAKVTYGIDIFEILGKKPLSEAEIQRQIAQLPKV